MPLDGDFCSSIIFNEDDNGAAYTGSLRISFYHIDKIGKSNF